MVNSLSIIWAAVVVAQNKQIIKGNIIELMESSVGFVYKNIQVGVSFANGGSSLPEYPEDLIRETVNNALAHRDYKNDKFVVINIKPNESIEISNPGFFLEKQKIFIDENIKTRRIIPITQVRNPKLADLLKSFDRLEARGKGLASLTNACLKNEIDMPYFILNQEHIRLFINKGKVYDDEMQVWLDSFSGHILAKNNQNELTEAEKIVLSYFYKSEKLNRLERYTILLTSDNNHFAIIADLEAKQLIYKHPHSSQIYPIYLVDRVLTKIEFSDELRQIFGQDYTNLGSDYKKVLNAIYQHNEYAAHKIVSANSIGTYLYLADNKRVMDIKHYENYKRKIRNIFHRLEEKQFIRRKVEQKPDFVINKSFSQLTVSMFDNQ
ncbi:MAG: hypothetical protein MUE85_23610 [Microscillaceae bacterium]|nr:hypothetical protein [Microscillaceae bacterium]